MTELTKFKETFSNKSKITQGVYISNYKKLRNLLDDVDIASVSQKKVIETAETIDNRNTQQSLINIAYLIRKNEGLAINELEAFRKKNQSFLKDKIYETNTALVDKLPSYDELVNFIDGLLKDQKYTQYVINYLLLHCSLERIAKEAERMKMEMPVKNVRSSYDYHLSLLLIYCFLSLTEFRVN